GGVCRVDSRRTHVRESVCECGFVVRDGAGQRRADALAACRDGDRDCRARRRAVSCDTSPVAHLDVAADAGAHRDADDETAAAAIPRAGGAHVDGGSAHGEYRGLVCAQTSAAERGDRMTPEMVTE